ncbi:MAG: hypothetical protein IPM29_17025 [Planctomycetes bacterium]|nr:hypothetical protein [Planctomycetota bacterium]
MAKSRRKKSGCRSGAFKRKPMGKGWAAHRTDRGRPLPVDRTKKTETAEADTTAAAAGGGADS